MYCMFCLILAPHSHFLFKKSFDERTKSRASSINWGNTHNFKTIQRTQKPHENEVFLRDCLINSVPTSLLLSFFLSHTKTHTLPLPGGPISQGKGCTAQRTQPTQTRRLNPLAHAVTYITETRAGPLSCNMPICSAPENCEGKQSSGGWKKSGGGEKKQQEVVKRVKYNEKKHI